MPSGRWDVGLAALQLLAKQRRTDLYLRSPSLFISTLYRDIEKLCQIAEKEGLTPAVRLNGTSDILWERTLLFNKLPQVYDYTKVELEHRKPPPNYHLTYSVGGPEDMPRAISYLCAGHSVAIVTTEAEKDRLVGTAFKVGDTWARFIDGDEHDLRFLDPPSSVVLLKPKGRIITDLVRPDPLRELSEASAHFRARQLAEVG